MSGRAVRPGRRRAGGGVAGVGRAAQPHAGAGRGRGTLPVSGREPVRLPGGTESGERIHVRQSQLSPPDGVRSVGAGGHQRPARPARGRPGPGGGANPGGTAHRPVRLGSDPRAGRGGPHDLAGGDRAGPGNRGRPAAGDGLAGRDGAGAGGTGSGGAGSAPALGPAKRADRPAGIRPGGDCHGARGRGAAVDGDGAGRAGGALRAGREVQSTRPRGAGAGRRDVPQPAGGRRSHDRRLPDAAARCGRSDPGGDRDGAGPHGGAARAGAVPARDRSRGGRDPADGRCLPLHVRQRCRLPGVRSLPGGAAGTNVPRLCVRGERGGAAGDAPAGA